MGRSGRRIEDFGRAETPSARPGNGRASSWLVLGCARAPARSPAPFATSKFLFTLFPFGASAAATFKPPTQHRDMPSQRVLGLCWTMGSSSLSVSVKYASCILVGFMTVARPAEPARTAPDRSRWLASGRGTSSRRSFMGAFHERVRWSLEWTKQVSRSCRCVVPCGSRVSVSDLSKGRCFSFVEVSRLWPVRGTRSGFGARLKSSNGPIDRNSNGLKSECNDLGRHEARWTKRRLGTPRDARA